MERFYKVLNDINNFRDSSFEMSAEIVEKNSREEWFMKGNLGCMQYESKNHKLAIELLNRALTLKPNHGLFFKVRANAKEDIGQREDAIEDFISSLENEQHYSTYFQLGTCFLNSRKFGDAIHAFTAAIQLKTDNTQFEEVLPYFMFGVPIRIDFERIYGNRANAYYNLNEFEKTKKDCIKALSYNRNYPNAHFLHGVALLQEGKIKEGKDSIHVAANLGFQPAILTLAQL